MKRSTQWAEADMRQCNFRTLIAIARVHRDEAMATCPFCLTTTRHLRKLRPLPYPPFFTDESRSPIQYYKRLRTNIDFLQTIVWNNRLNDVTEC